MLYKHESFFCFFINSVPPLSLVWGAGLHTTCASAPYAYFSLPCIWAGAPAYPFFQRLTSRSQPFFHPSTLIVDREGTPDSNSRCRYTHVAGASFSVGAADVQGGGLPPLPAPLFQERQGKRSWSTAHLMLFHGSFCALWSRGRNGRPRCQGFFGFSAVGIWEENGAITVLVAVVTVAVQVLEARHG